MESYYIDSEGWLHGPNVTRQPIPEATTQPTIFPWSIILHSNAGPQKTTWESLWKYWNRADVTGEAHFQVSLDGHVLQAIPVIRRADCNAKANQFPAFGGTAGAISIETQDLGAALLPSTVWPQPQFDAIANICAAVGHKYGVPYTMPTHWSDRGIGHHSLYPEWSIYKGKTCPGAARIKQMDEVRRVAATLCACEPVV